MPTRAVVFDLYGTLIDDAPPSDYARFLAETARVIGVDPERFRVAWEANDVARYTTSAYSTSMRRSNCGSKGCARCSFRAATRWRHYRRSGSADCSSG